MAYRADIWQIQEAANERQLAEESDDDGEEISETAKKMGGKKVGVFYGLTGDLETHPKRLRKPNISTNTPMVGHLRKTRRIPPKKQTVPRSLFLRAKKKNVFCGPMMRKRPPRKRTCMCVCACICGSVLRAEGLVWREFQKSKKARSNVGGDGVVSR